MCLLSYTKTCDNKVIQKYLLLRGLMHGQSDTDEADDRRFFIDADEESVRFETKRADLFVQTSISRVV